MVRLKTEKASFRLFRTNRISPYSDGVMDTGLITPSHLGGAFVAHS
jgi:hypothetical protein